jgi:hypothetical protein
MSKRVPLAFFDAHTIETKSGNDRERTGSIVQNLRKRENHQ